MPKRRRSKKLSSATFLSMLLLPAAAIAGQLDEPVGPEDENEVWQGNETEPCAFPSVVRVSGGGGLCTGSLIHPEIVLYAAHCGAQDKAIYFGDSQNSSKTRQVEYCKTYPGYNNVSTDWAYCKLAEPMFDIPITPVGFGCEINQYYGNNQQIMLVGFGNNEGDSGAGRKRWDWSYMSNANNGGFDVGGGGVGTVCSGDSGGPAYIRYDDGTWRVYGIASIKYDDTCSSAPGRYAFARNAMQWVETDSGVDVTVCHDLNGDWNPGPYCGNFFNGEPALSYGSWNTWCQDATALEWGATCGQDFETLNSEDNAPFLMIAHPLNGDVFPGDPETLDIEVMTGDDSGLPVDVNIEINGMPIGGVKSENPSVWADAAFPCGEYTINAYGEDFWGNQGMANSVTFEVLDGNGNSCVGGGEEGGDPTTGDGDGDGDDPATGDGDGDETAGESESDSAGETTGFPGGDTFGTGGLGEQDQGCACGVADGGSGGGLAWALLGFVVLGATRRRED